ncbi:hypothetical protein HMPREF6745_0904, partial [Prevotella sp. oral taxon 472 str. F0295]
NEVSFRVIIIQSFIPYRLTVTLFHITWTIVPYKMEGCSR